MVVMETSVGTVNGMGPASVFGAGEVAAPNSVPLEVNALVLA